MKALRETPPPARRGFTLADQVHQLVTASEADPDMGFMARLMALCSLPRTNPGNQYRYVRVAKAEEINGIEQDLRRGEVQRHDAFLLSGVGTVLNAALRMREYGPGQGVTGFAFVEACLEASASSRNGDFFVDLDRTNNW